MLTTSRKLPPSERDFEIYEAVHVNGCSTWSQADKHQISQTRVRQIIRRVVEWLGEVLPPQAKVAREQETHLARQIAASRFQHQLEEATMFWDQTRELRYAGLRIRLTTAQARLGVVGGIIDGLAADAIEGIPVPVWQPSAEPNREGEVPGRAEEPDSNPHPFRKSWAPKATADKSRRSASMEMPRELRDPLTVDELTPEIVAARAAWGYPIHPNLIEFAKQDGKAWPRAEAAASPPVEDFSRTDDEAAPRTEQPAVAADSTSSQAMACDRDTTRVSGASAGEIATSQGLLTPSESLSVTEVRIAPGQPAALISQAASGMADSRLLTSHSPLLISDS